MQRWTDIGTHEIYSTPHFHEPAIPFCVFDATLHLGITDALAWSSSGCFDWLPTLGDRPGCMASGDGGGSR